MDEIPNEIVDPARLRACVESSLGDVEKLRRLESFITNDTYLHSVLEKELLKVLGNCEDDVYVHWLCGTLKSLRLTEWSSRKEQMIAAVCDMNFSGGPRLMELALRSKVLDRCDVVRRANQLPRSVLLRTLRLIPDNNFVPEVADRLSDECLLLVFLVHASHTNAEAVKRYLSEQDRRERLNAALSSHYDSQDPSLRRFSLALLKVLLDATGNSHGDLIVTMLTVAEQKQVHLVEPVLNLFVDAVRAPGWAETHWTLLVFRRLFNHQTTWVKMQSLRFFLELIQFHDKYLQTGSRALFCHSLLEPLDHLGLFSRNQSTRIGCPAELGGCLRRWLQTLQLKFAEERFDALLSTFIGTVCSLRWSSVALLYVSEAIVALRERPVLDDTSVISNALTLWSFQEPLLKEVITRYWLQIGCRFSRSALPDVLAEFIDKFVESCECVRDFVVRIQRSRSSPVDICSAIWRGSLTAETLEGHIGDKMAFLETLPRIKRITTIRPELERIFNSSRFQQYAVDVLNGETCNDQVHKALLEVLSCCDIDPSFIDAKPSWISFCLRFSRCAEPDSSVIIEYSSLLSSEAELISLLSHGVAPNVFDCISGLCKTHPVDIIDMVDFVCNALPLAPRDLTPSLLRLLHANLDRESAGRTDLVRIVRLAWQSSLETRRATSLFADCVEVFVEILFHPVVVTLRRNGLQSLFEELETSTTNMAWFGEKFYGKMIQLLGTHPEYVSEFAKELAEGICYGPTFRKDQKVVLETESYVLSTHKNEEFRELSESRSAVSVRAKCISFVKKLEAAKIQLVVREIRAYDAAVSSTRKRYFNNSNIHRVKTRAWQAILVLLDSDFADRRDILESILDQLMNDSHQMTVRIFMEWCAVKILLATETHGSSIQIIAQAIEKASEERMGCICSYLNILMHICCAESNCSLVSSFVLVVLPWTMCQHFAVRLHAQFIFRRIIELCQCSTNCHSQFEPQLNALTRVVNYGGGAKNATKLHKDFYMAECVVTECETYELIFNKIPRAYGLTDVDCVPANLFDFDSKFSKPSSREVETDIQLEVLQEDPIRPDETTVVQESNFQRKIVPVSALFEEDRCPNSNKDELIVVASLIDRLPNLGGISRTCEIFGVSELVVPSLKMLELKEFQNLSVSSHQWLPIRGVGPQMLELYLTEKKKDGYTLIGVEQTAQSVSLEKFSFPKKSLLLLGNEKEGMPLHLIHLMDTCVEIPQQGVVRSLNVHVSAAILVWEYRKQFLGARMM